MGTRKLNKVDDQGRGSRKYGDEMRNKKNVGNSDRNDTKL